MILQAHVGHDAVRLLSAIGITLAVGACAYPQETYIDDYAQSFCAWDAGCGGLYYGDESTCVDVLTTRGEDRVEGCAYDAGAARDCVRSLEDWGCPAEGEDAVWPVTCDEAFYACPEE